MQRAILTAALALAATTAFAPAQAAPPAAALTVQTRVVYSDLDLTTEAGARTLLRRIKTAAEAGCGGSPFMMARSQTLTSFDNFNACRDAAVKQAVAAMRDPMLTYVANGRRGPRPNAYAGR